MAHRRGVKLHAGTDFGCFYGAPLHWELEFLVEAGLSPLEVLRIATQDAATAVGAEDQLGTLAPGKLADIVLLDANPIDDIKNTQTIWRVIKGGWVFDPQELRPPASPDSDN
jgi:imidazolonepropionase-like amidohydrolase